MIPLHGCIKVIVAHPSIRCSHDTQQHKTRNGAPATRQSLSSNTRCMEHLTVRETSSMSKSQFCTQPPKHSKMEGATIPGWNTWGCQSTEVWRGEDPGWRAPNELLKWFLHRATNRKTFNSIFLSRRCEEVEKEIVECLQRKRDYNGWGMEKWTDSLKQYRILHAENYRGGGRFF